MPVMHELTHRAGCEAHAIFEHLDFLRNPDTHATPRLRGRKVTPAAGLRIGPTARRWWGQSCCGNPGAAGGATRVTRVSLRQASASIASPASMRDASIDAKPRRA